MRTFTQPVESDDRRRGDRRRRPLVLLAIAGLVTLSGCFGGKPSDANIALRKQNAEAIQARQRLEQEVQTQREQIRVLESRSATTVPTLPADRLEQLFTVHGIKLGRLTGAADLDTSKPGIDGLKVYVVPTDAAGDELKASGSFKVEAFDLAAAEPRAGAWSFPVEQAKSLWNGAGILYEYVLPCPFERLPTGNELTLKVTFTDALTQRSYSEQRVIQLKR